LLAGSDCKHFFVVAASTQQIREEIFNREDPIPTPSIQIAMQM
jgi:hypothetical protein